MPDEMRTKFFKDIFKQNIILQNLKNNELTPQKTHQKGLPKMYRNTH